MKELGEPYPLRATAQKLPVGIPGRAMMVEAGRYSTSVDPPRNARYRMCEKAQVFSKSRDRSRGRRTLGQESKSSSCTNDKAGNCPRTRIATLAKNRERQGVAEHRNPLDKVTDNGREGTHRQVCYPPR